MNTVVLFWRDMNVACVYVHSSQREESGHSRSMREHVDNTYFSVHKVAAGYFILTVVSGGRVPVPYVAKIEDYHYKGALPPLRAIAGPKGPRPL